MMKKMHLKKVHNKLRILMECIIAHNASCTKKTGEHITAQTAMYASITMIITVYSSVNVSVEAIFAHSGPPSEWFSQSSWVLEPLLFLMQC
jgi:hypothetical protein